MWSWCSKYELTFSNCFFEAQLWWRRKQMGCHHHYHLLLLLIKKAGVPISAIYGAIWQRLKVSNNWISFGKLEQGVVKISHFILCTSSTLCKHNLPYVHPFPTLVIGKVRLSVTGLRIRNTLHLTASVDPR